MGRIYYQKSRVKVRLQEVRSQARKPVKGFNSKARQNPLEQYRVDQTEPVKEGLRVRDLLLRPITQEVQDHKVQDQMHQVREASKA